MIIQDIIAKKRDGGILDDAEIAFFVQNFVQGTIGEEQAAALLMAIYINGMNERELTGLTIEMAASGKALDLSNLPGVPVDKHSTGGVGDKLTLVAAPLAAAAGVTVAKMSGRGLGHTGGTIDKLEAVSGLRTEIGEDDFLRQVMEIGLAIVSQSNELVPADKLIYDLRNRTATVSSLPLIASSIMSKKLAAGCPKILLDVTVGTGAFMKNLDDALELARTMVEIGKNAGRETVALLTNMDEPLGKAIGNSLEVAETIATLQGNGPDDLTELALIFVAEMIELAGLGKAGEQRAKLQNLLASGAALERFKAMVKAQGGNVAQIDKPALLPLSTLIIPIIAPTSGYVSRVDALLLGEASVYLGAGRLHKGDELNYASGIKLNYKTGSKVCQGEALCWLHSDNYELVELARPLAEAAFAISQVPPQPKQLILGRIN